MASRRLAAGIATACSAGRPGLPRAASTMTTAAAARTKETAELDGKIAVLPPDSKSSAQLGHGRPALLRGGVPGCRSRQRRLHDQQRRGRSPRFSASKPSRRSRRAPGDPARQPRLGQRRGDHRRRQVAGRDHDRLRPPDRRRRRRLLRVGRRDRSRPPPGARADRGSARASADARIAILDGAPTDSFATDLKRGYEEVLESEGKGIEVAAQQPVPTGTARRP